MPARRKIAVVASAALLGGVALHASIDRHPETRSRAVAWTEYDGAFLVDTNSRADMLNFYWMVLARPYPNPNWTGSAEEMRSGTTNEAWRAREYGQLNAYRALNFTPALLEDSALLPVVEDAALVLAANRRLSHLIDMSWKGYSESARVTLLASNLANYQQSPFTGVVDQFIFDHGEANATLVGHRTNLLHPTATLMALGAARNLQAAPADYVAMQVGPFTSFTGTAASGDFVAWPAPGYIPLALLRPAARNNFSNLRWSFKPAVTSSESDFAAAIVTATVNGHAVSVVDQRYTRAWPITWEFAEADLNLPMLKSDTTVEIAITNATVRGQPITYRYRVTLFDENEVRVGGFSPRTPLINISTRGEVGAGDRAMIAGFVVDGSLPLRIALRSQGPSLTRFGLERPIRQTRLTLYDSSGGRLADNTAWRQHQDWRLLEATGTAPADDNEAGMVATLWPGAYTAVLSSDTGVIGPGLVEVFNIDNLSAARLINLSTRGNVGTGEGALIAGFVIKDQPRLVVLRTQGPSLTRFNLSGAVTDTILRLVSSDGVTIAMNDDWRTGQENGRLHNELVSFAPVHEREAALAVRLSPGAYTAVVEAKGSPGIGLIEVFDLP